ncbi:MAG: DUF4340 domain-containing protein [Oscillospiraceae bacterium]|nr:DUF4340 domain-containing protein [Oscillospiraceae bacterium]
MKKLSKKTRTLIFSCAGLAILTAAILVLVLTQESPPVVKEEDPTEPMANRVHFTQLEAEDLLSLSVFNEHEAYTLERTDTGALGIEALLGAPLSFTKLHNSERYISGLWAREAVEEDAKDFEQYGLGDTAAWAFAIFRNGETLELYIGDETPTVENMTYVRIAGENSVYVVWTYLVDYIKEPSLFYVSLEVTPDYMTAGQPDMERLVIDRAERERHVIIPNPNAAAEDRITSRYILVEPVQVQIDFTKGADLLEGMFGLTAFKAAFVGEELPHEFADGFNNPTAAVEMTVNGKTSTFTVGGRYYTVDDEGEDVLSGFYAIHSNYPEVLYVFGLEELSWLNFDAGGIMAPAFQRPMIYSVDELIIETAERTLNFRLTGTGRDDEEYFLDGVLADTAEFKQLYIYIISVNADALYDGEPEDVADMPFLARYTFRYRDPNRSDEIIEFFDSGGMNSVIVIDGEPRFITRAMYLTRLAQNIELFLNGEPVIISW